jgi:hypothetical protein
MQSLNSRLERPEFFLELSEQEEKVSLSQLQALLSSLTEIGAQHETLKLRIDFIESARKALFKSLTSTPTEPSTSESIPN